MGESSDIYVVIKMNDKNKKIAIIGGAGLAALYFFTRKGEEGIGLGGGGGGIPLLPGDVEESSDGGTGDIIYNFPEPGFSDDPFSGWDMEIDDVAPPKKLDLTKYDPRTTAFTLGITPEVPTPYSIKGAEMYAAGELSGGLPKKDETAVSVEKTGAAWWNPFSWDRDEAITNYESYVAASWGGKPEQFQFGGGSTGGTGGFGGDYSGRITSIKEAEKRALASKKAESSRSLSSRSSGGSSTSRSRGYSRMTNGGTPGWKQIGAKKPTAPGQPDRY